MLTTANKTIELLSVGQHVRHLQKSLVATGAVISEKELDRGIFGRSTQAAIKNFQVNHRIRANGIADARTLALLNPETVEDRLRKGDFSSVVRSTTTRRLIRKLEKIDMSQPIFSEDGSEISDALKVWKQGKLNQQIIDTFETPSESLITAVNALGLDADEVGNQAFSALLSNTVLPALLKNENLESEVFNFIQFSQLDSPESDNGGSTVAEILDLEGDIREVPELRSFVNTIRNEVFGELASLEAKIVEQLGDVDLLETDSILKQLEDKGILNSEQHQALRLSADLARLTDDNFKAMRVLVKEGVRESRDLVERSKTDWLVFIDKNAVSPPQTETAESYAELLDRGIEKAFSTAYTLTRYARSSSTDLSDKLAILEEIKSIDGEIFVGGSLSKTLDFSNIAEERLEDVRKELQQLSEFSNRYAALGITEILNDSSLSVSEKTQSIARRQSALNQAWQIHPDLDLKVANFFPSEDQTAEAFRVDLDVIDEDDRPFVRRALMSVQRVFQLSDSFDSTDKLLAQSIDSAAKIADFNDVNELALVTGLSFETAGVIYGRAAAVRSQLVNFVSSFEDTAGHAAFNPSVLKEANAGSSTDLINVLKDLPGYSELFGPQNYCKCKHCQSIFSPAAYFVDLMKFIHKQISRPNFIVKDREDHPLYLKNRRGDLWNLPLTCDNTNNTVIYLTIVNEVLENYLETVASLNGNVWAFLATEARSSFKQPFNLPHAQILLYLEYLGIGLEELSALFGENNKPAVYSVMGISPQELNTLAVLDVDAVRNRFAKPFTADLSEHNTAVLGKLAGVDRAILERLWSASFVRGNLDLSVEIESENDDLIGFVEHLRLNVPEGTEPDQGFRHFLERLHRFTRLYAALQWTPEEIQLVIDTLRPIVKLTVNTQPATFSEVLNETLLGNIADFKLIKEGLGLSVSEAIALCDKIPRSAITPEVQSLWVQLFGDKTQLEIRHPKLDNVTPGEAAVSSDFGVLQGALHLGVPELIALLQHDLGEDTLASGIVNEEEIDSLYQSARLARALDVSIAQLLIVFQFEPELIFSNSVSERLVALGKVLHWLNYCKDLTFGLEKYLDILQIETHENYLSDGDNLLAAVRVTLNENEKRWLTPVDFTRIEGVSTEASRAIISALENLVQPWLMRTDPTLERYLLTDAVAEEPDLLVIHEALAVPNGPLSNVAADDHSIDFLSEALSAELLEHHPAILARDTIAQALSISGEYAQALTPLISHIPNLSDAENSLSGWIHDLEAPLPPSLQAYATELVRLTNLFKNWLDVNVDVLDYIVQYASLFGISAGERWQWPVLIKAATFLTYSKQSDEKFLAYQVVLDSWNGAEIPNSASAELAIIFDINASQVDALLTEFDQASDPFATLRHLTEAVRLSKRSGLDPAALRQLTSTSFDGLVAAADILLGAMRSKYPEAVVWKNIEAPFLEKTEGLKRYALVDRILSRAELQFDNARDIYHFFLLDPDMDGCFLTSRVKNAISSCQLYVQRSFMGLEQTEPNDSENVRVIVTGAKSRDQWLWRKNYRVWEANRKVFLYPENYMLPDLRDDRSHIFKIAEENLIQGKLNDDSIDQLFKRYITEFVQIGNLEIVHILFEPNKSFSVRGTYLLFGRTKQEPFRYFMREFNGKKAWQPWQPINLDIGSRTISAVRKQGKLYLCWTKIKSNSDADKVMAANSPSITNASNSDPQNTLSTGTGGDISKEERIPVSLVYSSLNESGSWSSPKNIIYYNLLVNKDNEPVNQLLPISDTIYAEYPHPNEGAGNVENLLRIIHPVSKILTSSGRGLRQYVGFLRENDNNIIRKNGDNSSGTGHIVGAKKWHRFKTPGFKLEDNQIINDEEVKTRSTADVDDLINDLSTQYFNNPDGGGSGGGSGGTGNTYLTFYNIDKKRIWLRAVNRKTREVVLTLGDLQYLVKNTGKPGYDIDLNPQNILQILEAISKAKRKLISLNSSWPRYLSEKLYSSGVFNLLSLESQSSEQPRSWNEISYNNVGQIRPTEEDLLSVQDHMLAQFDGVHGDYLWEIFFHLPVLIAYTLNSQGKFEEADRWYRFIFDPTASTDKPKEHWRFVVFRSLKIPKLREILTQTSAIKAYKNDPFNPYAIARLRPSAFEKNILMRYIDNLLDWGDSLFSRDTRESINEALLLYIMAADLLGERPIETGECEVADSMTYNDILLRNTGGEFLIELENFILMIANLDFIPINTDPLVLAIAQVGLSDTDPDPINSLAVGSGFKAINSASLKIDSFAITKSNTAHLLVDTNFPSAASSVSDSLAFESVTPPDPEPPAQEPGIFDFKVNTDQPDPDGPIQLARTLGFCVPPNETLLGYWDRVDDRLYKLRHCMNIDGVERQLPLWQPPIDPMLLVRAKTAGLTLDEVLSSINENPPFQRFEILLERARRFTATVQQLGSQLLSALEGKDENELVLLRSVHENEILNLSQVQKQDAIKEAQKAKDHLNKLENTIKLRKNYYGDLLNVEMDLMMNAEELDTLTQMEQAKESQSKAGMEESQAQSIREVGPQWSVGFSGSAGLQFPLGGIPLVPLFARASVDASAHWGSQNEEAGYSRRALNHRDASSKHSALANMSSIKGSHKRRIDEWQFQNQIAQSEIDALVPQKAAADIHIALAEKDLEVHDAQIKINREIFDFAKDRFTNLGLYTFLSTSLSRLHREAYDMAFKMAQVTERAYRFELGEDKYFIKMDNWKSSRAGLLSGDQLLLQLQAMEASFVEKDKRRQEITLPCSLKQINPGALLALRQTGATQITIPEWWFDLYYPGQYRRLLQTVRLTIPCITGPYNNVGAKLTLLDSAVRATPTLNNDGLVGVQIGRNTSISTSSANADPGVFELRFDAPKNPPFKGAGAVSSWALVMPEVNRVFDYSTISDVIIELSYTADDDGLLRQNVEGSMEEQGSLDAQLAEGLNRVVSLKHEFPSEFHRLMSTDLQALNAVNLSLTRTLLFPYWIGERIVTATIDIAIEPRSGQTISSADILGSATVTLNNEELSNWFDAIDLGSIPVVSSENQFIVAGTSLDLILSLILPEEVEISDLLLIVNYRID
jgi:hypothetical protein